MRLCPIVTATAKNGGRCGIGKLHRFRLIIYRFFPLSILFQFRALHPSRLHTPDMYTRAYRIRHLASPETLLNILYSKRTLRIKNSIKATSPYRQKPWNHKCREEEEATRALALPFKSKLRNSLLKAHTYIRVYTLFLSMWAFG